MTYGLMEAEEFFEKLWVRYGKAGQKKSSGKTPEKDMEHSSRAAGGKFSGKTAAAAVAFLVLCNTATVLGNYRYGLTYDHAAAYIAENIPAGAKVYCTSYMPLMDEQKYEIVEIGEDISLLPEKLAENEYFIDVEYATGYFSQKKDYLLFRGGDMYPDKKAAYEQKTGAYTVVESWQGVSYGGEWKYRIGYFDLFTKSPTAYYVGPSITIYQ